MKKIYFFILTLVQLPILGHAQGVIRIASLDPGGDAIILENLGDSTLDISGYWLCLGPGQYNALNDYTEIVGDLILDPTPEAVIIDLTSGSGGVTALPDSMGGLGLFSTNSFSSSNPDTLIDYVQWGAADQARVGQAVTAGRWDDPSSFLSGDAGTGYAFLGEANEIGISGWQVVTNTREVLRPEIALFPNPTRRLLRVTNPGRDIVQIRMIDITGRVLDFANQEQDDLIEIDLGNLPNGMYMLEVLDKENRLLQSGQVIKQ